MALPPRPRAGMPDRHHDGLKSRDLSPGSVVLGRYTILKVLGRGGMATVYLARHQQTERLVALKMLDPEISRDPHYVERFRREARAAGRIRNDHVVAIYDLDAEVGGGLVLVMEYLEGETVQQALRGGRMPLNKVLSFGRHLLDGLAAAHEAGVIHRDLKPANLFIEKSSTGGEKLKILDFGISKLADASQQELTRDGQTIGTVAYMAPEQIRGKAAATDVRVDLYAAGVSIFLMLTGKRPIDADDTVQLLAAVLENPPLSLAQATGTPWPKPLEDFISKALQKDPNRRFQTAIEMRDALLGVARVLGHEFTGPIQLAAVPTAVPIASSGTHIDPTPSGVRNARAGAPPAPPANPAMIGFSGSPLMPAPPPAAAAMPANPVDPLGSQPLLSAPSPLLTPPSSGTSNNTTQVPVPVAPKRGNKAAVMGLIALGAVSLLVAIGLVITRKAQSAPPARSPVAAQPQAPAPRQPASATPPVPAHALPSAPETPPAAPVAQPAPSVVAPAPAAAAPAPTPSPSVAQPASPAPSVPPAPAAPTQATSAPLAPRPAITNDSTPAPTNATPNATGVRRRRPRSPGIVEEAPF